jgi:hypothetical protein
MAIKNVPNVLLGGQANPYGGVIYGLNTSIGYSAEPSKITIDIVNDNGIYATPTLNVQTSVTFGNFRFNGTVWSYSLKESAAEKTLQVTLIDNSIILDRHYVLLWKRGLLGENGRPQGKDKTFDFSDESILVPRRNTRLSGFPYTEFIEKRLGRITVPSKSYSLGSKRVGNVILIGHEKFANSVCDIPDTYYTFNDLRGEIPVTMASAPNNSIWKATHEGSLREVLSSWCSDLGFDYYWDFSSNTLRFFDVSVGINNIPDISRPSIVSKEKSVSMQGTFRQYGIGYTAMPRSAVKALSASKSRVVLYSLSPYPISYFINKIGAPQSINADKGRWGGKRSQDNFVHAAFLGYVSRSLRDLYSFQNSHWEALGYKVDSGIATNKPKIISALKKFGFQDMISDLEAFDAKDLPNYDFNFISRDPTIADKWHEIEQKLLQYHGRYYRASDSSGSFFYCNSNYTIEVEISVDPEGQVQEQGSENFAGRKIIDRGGTMSHDETSAQEAIGYENLTNEIQNCAPIHIDLKESGISDALVTAKILTGAQSKKINTLVIFPNSQKFVKNKIGFTSSTSRGLHPLEQTYYDQKNANIQSGKKNCPQYDDSLERGSCKAAEEIARDKAIEAAGGTTNETDNPDDYVSGLVTKTAKSCSLSLRGNGGGGTVRIFAPSDGSYQVVCRYNININKISTVGTEQFLWSAGSPGGANDVAEIRINNENITDPDEDSFQSRRPTNLIKPADAVCSRPQEEIKYVFAGEPEGLTLSPQNGLSNLDISLSSDGFTTSATFSTKPPKLSKANNTVRYVQSQFNRASYNAS